MGGGGLGRRGRRLRGRDLVPAGAAGVGAAGFACPGNYDAGETLGWPEFVRNVGEVRARLGPDIAILTDNYGEAGAIERFGAPYDLPTPHSGHNAYWWWGPPDDSAVEVLTVGIDREQLDRYCTEVESAGRIENGLGIDNDEQGAPMNICRGPRVPLAEIWPRIRHLG